MRRCAKGLATVIAIVYLVWLEISLKMPQTAKIVFGGALSELQICVVNYQRVHIVSKLHCFSTTSKII